MSTGGDEELGLRSGEQWTRNVRIQSGMFLWNVGTQLLDRTVSLWIHTAMQTCFVFFPVPSIFCFSDAGITGGGAVQVCVLFKWYRLESQSVSRPSSWTVACVWFACIYRRMLERQLTQAGKCSCSVPHCHRAPVSDAAWFWELIERYQMNNNQQ
jgi:hypothetical protein